MIWNATRLKKKTHAICVAQQTDEELTESDDLSHDDNDELCNDANKPIYEGARISVGESILSILTVTLRFKVTGVLLSYILSLILLHCTEPNNCVKTLYKLKKFFAKINTPLVKHYYCSSCLSKLETQFCRKCKNKENISYFMEISILSQLASFYKRPNFKENLKYRLTLRKENSLNFKDVYYGSVYKSLPQNFLNNNNNTLLSHGTLTVCLFSNLPKSGRSI